MGYIFWRDLEGDRIKTSIAETEIEQLKAISRGQPGKAHELEDMKRKLADELRSRTPEVAAAGPIAKALGPEVSERLRVEMGVGEGDAVFFLAGRPAKFEAVAGKARNVIGRELGHTAEDRFELAWIVDFPMYEKDEDTGVLDFSHNPFSMPQGGIEALDGKDPLDVLGYQYDIVCNGVELSSGAVRNHKPEIMYRAFEIVGKDRAFVDGHFGGMLSAFRYGAPPHAGIAPGIDRIVMLLAGAENIREVIMFPMNQRAEDLMMGAPSQPINEQLRDLGLRLAPKA